MLVIINGRICRIIGNIIEYGPDQVKIDVVTGFRTLRSTSGARPGSSWRPDPSGDKKKWVKHKESVTKGAIVNKSAIITEYPIGWEEFGKSEDELVTALTPLMQRAMASGGTAARRARPNIRYSVIVARFKREGLPLPTEVEFDGALTEAWFELKPGRKRGRPQKAGGRTLIPPKHVPSDKARGNPPEGVELKDNERWSALMNAAVPLGKEGDLMEGAIDNGWPAEFLEGAGERTRGVAGATLYIMNKNKYDPDRYGTVESHGLATEKPEDKLEDKPEETIEDKLVNAVLAVEDKPVLSIFTETREELEVNDEPIPPEMDDPALDAAYDQADDENDDNLDAEEALEADELLNDGEDDEDDEDDGEE